MRWLGLPTSTTSSPNRLGRDPFADRNRPRRASLALGGGGARGIAHLGVMQALIESGMQIDRIVGVSMGSLAGAMIACAEDIAELQQRATAWIDSPEFVQRRAEFGSTSNDATVTKDAAKAAQSWYSRLKGMWAAQRKLTRAVTSSSLLPNDALRHAIDSLLPDCDLRDLEVPLSVVAIDLLSGRRVTLESGSVRKAVLASASIPGIFPPVKWGKRLLADIGLIESIPVGIARSYARDLTVAVDVGQTIAPIKRCDTALDVMMRVDDICERIMRRHITTGVDILIRPDVGDVPWFDFSNPEVLIRKGYTAGRLATAQFNP